MKPKGKNVLKLGRRFWSADGKEQLKTVRSHMPDHFSVEEHRNALLFNAIDNPLNPVERRAITDHNLVAILKHGVLHSC